MLICFVVEQRPHLTPAALRFSDADSDGVMFYLSVDDVLSQDSGECSICLDDMVQGDTIARLPCLCVYHKGYENVN